MAENKNDFVSDRRLYLDRDGKVVEHNDPAKLTLLVAEGGRLSAEDAEKYGLGGDEDEDGAEETDGDEGESGDESIGEGTGGHASFTTSAPAKVKAKTKAPVRKK